ncbi:DUF4256 domain-containing protein [Eubacteriaceae bacterium ES2]|nr:DUF4256 domain-containing protein [Eubacteriaceae bacterium ES2]
MDKNFRLLPEQINKLVLILEERFKMNMNRHPAIGWENLLENLQHDPTILQIIFKMEETGGQPDLVNLSTEKKIYYFMDCSPESPEGRRNLCYDREALEKRKKNKPQNSAMDMAKEIGIEILTEDQYRSLQQLGQFDTKSSSWVKTPDKIRKLGGATFCDRRYDTVFMYHNGADSYYSARGFRGCMEIEIN